MMSMRSSLDSNSFDESSPFSPIVFLPKDEKGLLNLKKSIEGQEKCEDGNII